MVFGRYVVQIPDIIRLCEQRKIADGVQCVARTSGAALCEQKVGRANGIDSVPLNRKSAFDSATGMPGTFQEIQRRLQF